MTKTTKQELYFERICKEIDIIKNKVEDSNSEEQAKIKILKSKVVSYEDILAQAFEKLSPKENEGNLDTFLRYQEILCDLLVDLEGKTKEEVRCEITVNSENKQTSLVKLPKFDLPHFYGDSEQWISFKELFKSTILENESLSKIEKLQYLHSALRSTASKLIKGFSLREENLQQCWELLCERFDNKRQLALSQVNKIFSVKVSKANNSKSLLELVDTSNEAIRNLETLGLESNSLSDLMVINHMMTKLDQPIKQRWELHLENDKIPTLEVFRKFLEREARSLEESKSSKTEFKFNLAKKPLETVKPKTQLVHNAITNVGDNCVVCNQNHPLYKCPAFNSKPVKERWKTVEQNQLCQNCFRKNHKLENCRISIKCKNCAKNHHTLLHVYKTNQFNYDTSNNNIVSEQSVSNSAQSNSCMHTSNVLLSTAVINVKSSTGNVIQCRALIDNASQNSLISKECAKRLKLPLMGTNHKLVGINSIQAETCLNFCEVVFSPHFENNNVFSVKALVVSQVTTPLPNFRLTRHCWHHTNQLQLADEKFYKSGTIDLLLGADIFAQLLVGIPIMGKRHEPCAIPTKLGFILSGPISTKSSEKSVVTCHAVNLEDFFELEAVPNSGETLETDPAESFYKTTTRRNSEGRYIVNLPLQPDFKLGDSKYQALRIFYALENKFARNPQLKAEYNKFMEEYIKLGHMEVVQSDRLDVQPNFYLPHHSVQNMNSSTTKLRVVFNASAKSSNGQSLNSVLFTGPKLQSSIFENLIKFRLYKVALTSDITKMYRQILISTENLPLQRIFWRQDPSEQLKIYELKTVTYGTSCAPFLALRTIQQLCADEYVNFPTASKIARDHMYVDDFLGGANSVESAQELISNLQNLFQAGCFELRKWASNEPTVLSNLPDSLKASTLNHSLNPDSSQRVLGLEWNFASDSLKVQVSKESTIRTKRELLSIIARIFDPLALLSPSTIMLKTLLQEVWKAKLDWDDPLPVCILEKWERFHTELDAFNNMKIPRYLNLSSSDNYEIHGFCDSSTQAYAAVVYLKRMSDPVIVSLVAAKTRIAPVTPVTLPRLELCSALLLSELITVILRTIPDPNCNLFLWTDSTIALSWILNPPIKGNQFALHRANKIQSLTPLECWHHIPGKGNPADCATRGLYPNQLRSCQTWWIGPTWLQEDSTPFSHELACSSEQSEIPIPDETVSQPNQDLDILTRYSSYPRLLRVIAWLHRIATNCRRRGLPKIKDPLNATELDKACKTIVKLVQKTLFFKEINLLKAHKPLPKTNKLIALNVFLDSNMVLRVGGRLSKHKTMSFDAKHQMLLPKNHPVTEAIIRHYHTISLHAGPESVLALIREKFWILDGRSTVKKELRNCLRCKRASAQPLTQIMGDLPSVRVNPGRPFQQTGIDFAGPLNIKCQHIRKASIFKAYICLFVCLCTKAVHIELVSELTTEAFLMTLRRFISRRGCPTDLYSDNGRTFVGAASYLKKLFKLLKTSQIQDFSAQRQILWHFIPPYAPNFGGLWESSIKLAKRHLVKSVQGSLMSFEELTTTLCLIEACINSRPISPVSTDPQDLNPLTPGHFLIGEPLIALPEMPSNNNSLLSLSGRWKLVLQVRDHFWRRWSTDYLQSLSSRPKWKRGQTNLQPNQIVLVRDHMPPNQWKLARIQQTHPGTDGITRVVTVKTKDGTFKRPVQQIAILSDITTGPPEDMDRKKRKRDNSA